ncbi:MAG: glycosyltransferase family 87 protein [Actinomycetota bacterium]
MSLADRSRVATPSLVRHVVVALAIVFGLVSVGSRFATLGPKDVTVNDFTQDYVAARAWVHGANPYAPTRSLLAREVGPNAPFWPVSSRIQRNPHPPAYVVAVSPFSLLPYKLARVLWLLASAVFISCALAIVASALKWRRDAVVAVALGGLAIPIVQTDLILGQSTGLLLLLFVLSWRLLQQHSDRCAGALLGVAAAAKLFPVFMIVPLLRMRRFKAAVAMMLTAVIVEGASMLLVGRGATGTFLHVVTPENTTFWRPAPVNISLPGVAFRWLTKNPWQTGMPHLPVIAFGLAALLGIACILGAMRTPALRSNDVFWSAIPWMILGSFLAWAFYAVLALPLLMLVGDRYKGTIPPAAVLLAFALVVVGPPPGTQWTIPTPPTRQLVEFALATYGLLLLCAGEWGIVGRRRAVT